MIKYLKSQDIDIYLKEDIVYNSKFAVLIIHGLAEHSGRYEDFVSKLNEANISVFSMDLRGHGRTTGKRGDFNNIEKVLSDVNVVVKYIKEEYQFLNVGIFGHSVGGMITSIYASLNSSDIDFIILSSPAIYCPKKLKILKIIPFKLLPFVYVKKRHSESNEMLEYSKKDELALHKFSIRMVGVLFVDSIKLLNSVVNIDKPTLMVCGKQDRLLNSEENFKKFFDKLNNIHNKMIVYNNAKHRIVQNEGCDERIKDIIEWISSLKF